MRPNNNPLFTAAVINATLGSNVAWATDIIRASAQVVFTGNPTGTLQFQGSDDHAVGLPPNLFQPTNWSLLGSSVAVSAAGIYLLPYFESCYEYLRVLYTDGSGGAAVGTMTGRLKTMAL